MLVVPRSGTLLLARLLGLGPTLSPTMGLFVNNIFPTHDTTMADITEASFAGYGRQGMGGPAPINPQADGSAIMLWSPVMFSATAPAAQTAYGYFVVQTDPVTEVVTLAWIERVAPAIDWSIPGQALLVNPQLVVQTLFG